MKLTYSYELFQDSLVGTKTYLIIRRFTCGTWSVSVGSTYCTKWMCATNYIRSFFSCVKVSLPLSTEER